MLDLTAYQRPEKIQQALAKKRIAVVGMSNNPARASNSVSRYMLDIDEGYRLIPVNPRYSEIFGLPCFPDLLSAREAVGEIDTVNVFRDSSAVPAIAAEAIAVGASVLWLQLGVIHADGIRLAEQAGMNVVVDRCLKIVHRRFLGASHRSSR